MSTTRSRQQATPLRCHVLGHRHRFDNEGHVMVWGCERQCGAGGTKEYDSARTAAHYAAAFDRPANADLGHKAPLLGMFPLRIWRWLRSRGDRTTAAARVTGR